MIAYTTIGTNDLPRAAAFYDALLAEVGAGRAVDMGRLIAYASAAGQPMFAICTPDNQEPATAGNGRQRHDDRAGSGEPSGGRPPLRQGAAAGRDR